MMHRQIPVGTRPAIVCDRTYLNQIKRNKRELDKLSEECFVLYAYTSAIVLSKYFNFEHDRIVDDLKVVDGVFTDCKNEINTGSIEMAWDEIGIDMAMETATRPWYEIEFLNGSVLEDERMDQKRYLYLFLQEKKWIPTSMIASFLVGLHRAEGWEYDKCYKYFNLLLLIRDEYGADVERLKKASIEQVGFELIERKEASNED